MIDKSSFSDFTISSDKDDFTLKTLLFHALSSLVYWSIFSQMAMLLRYGSHLIVIVKSNTLIHCFLNCVYSFSQTRLRPVLA